MTLDKGSVYIGSAARGAFSVAMAFAIGFHVGGAAGGAILAGIVALMGVDVVMSARVGLSDRAVFGLLICLALLVIAAVVFGWLMHAEGITAFANAFLAPFNCAIENDLGMAALGAVLGALLGAADAHMRVGSYGRSRQGLRPAAPGASAPAEPPQDLRQERLEIIALSPERFCFSFPRPFQLVIGALGLCAALLAWRAAAYLVHAACFGLTGIALLPRGYPQVGAVGALALAFVWMSVAALFVLAAGLVAHVSREGHIRLNRRGVAVAISALLLWQLGAAFLALWAQLPGVPGIPPVAIVLCGASSGIAGFLLLARGARQFAIARMHMALGADEVLRRDGREPVLYLRSFESDQVRAPGSDGSKAYKVDVATEHVILPRFWVDRRDLTFEEFICRAMARFAPVIAIGRPGEKLPRLGASRKYVANHCWQSEVRGLMGIAKLTCLVLGESEGLLWEFRQLMEQDDPAKVLLLVPQGDDACFDWHAFIAKAAGQAGLTALPADIPGDTLAVFFRTGWRPVVIRGQPIACSYTRIARLLLGQHHR